MHHFTKYLVEDLARHPPHPHTVGQFDTRAEAETRRDHYNAEHHAGATIREKVIQEQ